MWDLCGIVGEHGGLWGKRAWLAGQLEGACTAGDAQMLMNTLVLSVVVPLITYAGVGVMSTKSLVGLGARSTIPWTDGYDHTLLLLLRGLLPAQRVVHQLQVPWGCLQHAAIPAGAAQNVMMMPCRCCWW